jgi:DNA invertase Pin-like site-specific DNA recombinase
VSTHEQPTLGLQREVRETYGQPRAWAVAVKAAESGAGASERGQREALRRATRRRTIAAMVVWRLARWGRSLAALVGTLPELQALGGGGISVSEALAGPTPIGRAMAGRLAILAECARAIRRERVKAGMAPARKRGPPMVARRPWRTTRQPCGR